MEWVQALNLILQLDSLERKRLCFDELFWWENHHEIIYERADIWVSLFYILINLCKRNLRSSLLTEGAINFPSFLLDCSALAHESLTFNYIVYCLTYGNGFKQLQPRAILNVFICERGENWLNANDCETIFYERPKIKCTFIFKGSFVIHYEGTLNFHYILRAMLLFIFPINIISVACESFQTNVHKETIQRNPLKVTTMHGVLPSCNWSALCDVETMLECTYSSVF